MGAQHFRAGILGAQPGHDLAPQLAGGAQLGDLHEEVHANAEKEAEAPRESIDIEATPLRCTDVFHAVGQRIGQLLHGRRPSLVHVIARDRDRVEFGHVLGGMGDNVADDPHRGFGRVDIGIADHELLEDVVLDGPLELGLRHALFFGSDNEHGQHRDHRAVHGHRNRHLVERDAVKQDFHVLDTVDGDASLAHIAHHAGMVAVIAAMGGQIESDRQPLLALFQRLPIEGVAFARRGKAGILADGPGAVGVHGRTYAAGERLDAGDFRVVAEINRLHLDPTIVAGERAERDIAQFLLRKGGPVGKIGLVVHQTASNSMMTSSTASMVPGTTRSLLTRARFSALRTFSIFIASTIASVCPSSTISPSAT